MQHLQSNTTLQGGKYRIERMLGQGGFGITYLARNTVFDVNVAIKEFFMKDENGRDGNSVTMPNTTKSELFNGQKEKFKKEAKRMFAIKNEHIIGVHDLFEENGTAYYVMDYIDGESLAARMKRTGIPMTENEVNNILHQILDALKVIHDNGIWHLDLKPANVMMDKAGNIKLIDFGASKQMNAQKGGATTSTAISYTNGYAPREQMEQNYDKFGPWTDLYALGATIYNLLTKQRPPMPTDIDDDRSEDKHLALPLPAEVSNQMRQLILWLMKTDRLERPSSVKEIQEFINKKEDDDVTVVEAPHKKEQPETLVEPKTPTTKQKAKTGNPSRKKGNSMKKMILAAFSIVILAVGGYFLLPLINSKHQDNAVVEKPKKDRIIQNLINNMVYVEGGTFTMGATAEQGSDADSNEKPAHQVSLSSFSIGRYEVTQEEWQAVMGSNPSSFKGPKRPVKNVSWDDCQAFIKKLNEMTGKNFRLPTEAEWEFASRGGIKSQGYKYSGSNNLNSVAWYEDNSGNTTHDVGQKSPNELGIYDMSGNVWELCQDWYDDVGNYYRSSPQTNPMGPSSGSLRVLRGGSWNNRAGGCRVSLRGFCYPYDRDNDLGLRLAH